LLGAVVAGQLVFSDHHDYSHEDISLIESKYSSSGAEAMVTTQKDLARLGGRSLCENTYTLAIRLEIEDNVSFAERINR
jgi:tetraacyldisaccharide-1-P 4'-kinase